MSQLIPFFFFNQLLFSFALLFAIIYVMAKFVLPLFTYNQVARMYISKLTKNNK